MFSTCGALSRQDEHFCASIAAVTQGLRTSSVAKLEFEECGLVVLLGGVCVLRGRFTMLEFNMSPSGLNGLSSWPRRRS